jgi:hypothetical protein
LGFPCHPRYTSPGRHAHNPRRIGVSVFVAGCLPLFGSHLQPRSHWCYSALRSRSALSPPQSHSSSGYLFPLPMTHRQLSSLLVHSGSVFRVPPPRSAALFFDRPPPSLLLPFAPFSAVDSISVRAPGFLGCVFCLSSYWFVVHPLVHDPDSRAGRGAPLPSPALGFV